MHRRNVALLGTIALLAPALVIVGVLADLRSPEGTAALGAELAADPGVQAALVAAVVESSVDDALSGNPLLASLAPYVRSVLTLAAETTLATPAGRAAVASALTDALRQLTLSGPIVIDLREAALAAADAVPPPIDAVVRSAVERGSVGIVVIGADGSDPDGAAPALPAGLDTGRVAGLPGAIIIGFVALLLIAALAGLLLPAPTGDGDGRRTRLVVAGATLAVVGGLALLVVRGAPDLVVTRLAPAPETAGTVLGDVLPVLVTGLAELLVRSGPLALALLVAGVALLVAGALTAEGTRPAADRRPRG